MLRRLAALLLVALAFAGCDSALDPEPFGIETLGNQLSSPEGAVPFANSFYQPMQGLYGSFGAPMAIALESGTDDAWAFAQFAGTYKERDVTGGEGEFSAIWRKMLGDGVGRANIYLDVEDGIDWSGQEELQAQLQGEAYFFRAFYHFNAVRIFGQIPILTERIQSVAQSQVPREPVADVYAQIKEDARRAIELLPEGYTGSGLGQERGRVTSGAARTLLAKVHLTLEEWDDVLSVTEPLAGTYSLRSDYVNNFYGLIQDTAGENREESIFEVQYAAQGTGPQHQLRVSYTPAGVRDGQNQILPTDSGYLESQPGAYGDNAFVQAFEDGDDRFGVTLNKFGSTRPSVTGTFPERDASGEVVRDGNGNVVLDREWFVSKWYSDVSNQETRWNIPIFRYAEVLLMRAEALAERGDAGGAVSILNQLRSRAGLGDLDASGQGDVIAAVRQERRVELGFEFKRFFDLNRWGILEQEVERQGVEIPDTKVTAHPITGKPEVLWPVPASELQRNPNSSQNAGY